MCSSPDPTRFFVNSLVENPASARGPLEDFLGDLITQLLRKASQSEYGGDYDVYGGEGGVLLTFLRVWRQHRRISPAHVDKALEGLGVLSALRDHEARAKMVDKAAQRTKGLPVTFLCGWSGLLCMQIEWTSTVPSSSSSSSTSSSPDGFQRLLGELGFPGLNEAFEPPQAFQVLLSARGPGCDELLYGRAGYLFSLLHAVKHCPLSLSDEQLSVITTLVGTIIQRGERGASRRGGRGPPLYYEWHEADYVGAAHGLAGICMVLIQVAKLPKTASCISQEQLGLVKECLSYIMKLPCPSGNYPSRIFPAESSKDRLVQFCHGAPGMVPLFCAAFELFATQDYLQAAIEASEAVWKYGLLRKGSGLCHGVAGNGYSFLSLYRVTKDQKHLHRAWQFAEFSMALHKDPQLRRQVKAHFEEPADEISLFEGTSGLVCYLLDVLNPDEALFPGYEL